MSPTRSATTVLLLLSACSLYASNGDDATDARVDVPDIVESFDAYPDAALVNSGFVTPTAVTKANVNNGGAWTEVGDADWTCLLTPSSDQPSTGTIALSGRVRDFQTGNGVGDATVTAWSTSPAATLGTATSSNVAATRGDYSLTLGMLPAGTRRYSFSLVAPGYLTAHVPRRYYAPGAAATDDLVMVSDATATALPAFIGVERDTTKVLYIGTLRDCQGRAVSNAVAALSVTSLAYQNAGGETFYFSAGNSSLPVRHNISPFINKDGLFTVVDAPPGTGFIQVWGFPSIGALNTGTMTLFGEIPVSAQGNEVVIMTVEPRRI
jgi:hypothetical protein